MPCRRVDRWTHEAKCLIHTAVRRLKFARGKDNVQVPKLRKAAGIVRAELAGHAPPPTQQAWYMWQRTPQEARERPYPNRSQRTVKYESGNEANIGNIQRTRRDITHRPNRR